MGFLRIKKNLDIIKFSDSETETYFWILYFKSK